MRLLELTISNFRGFGPAVETIGFDADLVLCYGPNGFGKTSLAEALEWLFYGTTKRRQRGELYSRTEYAGSFANAHNGRPVEVILKARVQGEERLLARRLNPDDESSRTFVDGAPATFATIPLTPLEAHYPIVTQHGLQTFIHSKPKDRRDAVCAALGLDELTVLKAALESARSSYQRSPPRAVVDARNTLLPLVPNLQKISEVTTVAQRWLKSPMAVNAERDTSPLIAAAAALAGRQFSDVEAALTALREARQSAARAVFDSGTIEVKNDHLAVIETFSAAMALLLETQGAIQRNVSNVAAAVAARYSGDWLSFWAQGLKLAEGEDCPMCETPNLDSAKKEDLQNRIEAGASVLAQLKALKTEGAEWAALAVDSARAKRELGTLVMDAAQRTALTRLLPDEQSTLQRFMDVHDELQAARAEFDSHFAEARRVVEGMSERAAVPADLPPLLADLDQSQLETGAAKERLCTGLKAYGMAWQELEPILAERVSSSDLVGRIDAVGKALANLPAIELLTRYDVVLDETQTLIREVEAEVQKKQTELLKTRGSEIKSLYQLLNPGSNVGFEGLEPGRDSMKLHATSFGVRMSAAANLSECQLNCLGLAMWLMRATTTGSPFEFVLLDDPVQSMDDDHAEAFMASVVPYLLDRAGKQVVVLSHVLKITDRLKGLNPHRRILHLHYESYAQGGPTIVVQARIQKMLAEIKQAAAGNENNRTHAVDRLRVLTESVIRGAYQAQTGQPAPPAFDRAQPKDLLALFQTIPGTTPIEHAGMKDTIGFCDPAHHTEVGYATPLEGNIRPHIDRIESIMRKYRVS